LDLFLAWLGLVEIKLLCFLFVIFCFDLLSRAVMQHLVQSFHASRFSYAAALTASVLHGPTFCAFPVIWLSIDQPHIEVLASRLLRGAQPQVCHYPSSLTLLAR